MCETYRCLKSKSKELSEDNEQLLAQARVCIDANTNQAELDPNLVVQVLEEKCTEKKRVAEQLRNKFDQVIFCSVKDYQGRK